MMRPAYDCVKYLEDTAADNASSTHRQILVGDVEDTTFTAEEKCR
jgi:hypothetical protein